MMNNDALLSTGPRLDGGKGGVLSFPEKR